MQHRKQVIDMSETEKNRAGIAGAVMVPHPPLIIPDVGRGEEKGIQATIDAYLKASEFVLSLHPDTIIISSPHSIMYRDYFHISPGNAAVGNFGQFRAPRVQISAVYDSPLRDEICKAADAKGFPTGDLGERDPSLDHATMIPLYFLQEAEQMNHGSAAPFNSETAGLSASSENGSTAAPVFGSAGTTTFRILRIGLSGLPLPMHYELGQMVEKAAIKLGRRIVWIASGDLSHKLKSDGPYGFSKDGPVYDERIMDVMGSGEFEKLFDFDEAFLESAAECGHRSFVEMAGAFDGLAVKTQKLSHEGPFGVGYGVCTFLTGAHDDSRHCLKNWEERKTSALQEKRKTEDPYVQLARASVEAYVRCREELTPEEAENRLYRSSQTMQDTAAVTKKDSANERALSGKEKLPPEMYENRAGAFVSIHENGQLRGCIGTISAVQENIAEEIIENAISASTRDPRFKPIRTDELPYLEITVDILGPAERISSPAELDVKRYGVIVTKGMKRGLLLPNLDGVDTVPQQIAIAKQKAGIATDDEDVELQRFEVVRHY